MGCCASTRGGGDGDLGFPDAAVPDPVFTARGKGDASGRSHSRSPGQDAGSRNPEAAGGTECWDGHVQEPQLHTKRSVSVVSTPSSAKQLRSPDASVSRVRAGSGRLAVPEEGLGDDGLCEIKLEAVEVAPAVGSAASPMPGAAAPTGSLGARASRSPAHAPHMHAFAPTDVGTADEAPRWLRTPASDSDVLMARRRTLVKRRSPEATSASAGKLVTSSNNAAGKFDVVRDPGVAVYVSDGSPRIVTLHSRMQYRMQHRSSSDSGVHTSSSRSRSRGSSFDLVDARQSSREWASTAVPPGRLVSSGSNAGSAESPSPKLQAAGRRRRSLPRVQMLRADAAADRTPVGPASSSDDASGGDDDLPVTRRRSRSDTPPRMRRRRRGLFVDTTSEPSVSPFAKSNVRVSPASAPQGRPRSGSLGFNTPIGGDGGRRMSRASPASPLSPFGRGRGRGSARGRGAGALRTQGSGSHSVDPLSRVLETRGRSTSAPEMMKPPQGLPVVSKALRGRNASGKIAQVQRPSTVAGRPRRRPRPAPLTPTGIAGRRMSLKLLFKRSHSADVTNFTPEPNQFPDPFANSPDEGLRGVDEADQCVPPHVLVAPVMCWLQWPNGVVCPFAVRAITDRGAGSTCRPT